MLERVGRIARYAVPALAAALLPLCVLVVGMSARLPAETGRNWLIALAGAVALASLASGALALLQPRIAHYPAAATFALALWAAISGRLVAPAALWRRELNDVVIETRGGPVAVSAIRFLRTGQP